MTGSRRRGAPGFSAERMAQARRGVGLTQEQLAKSLGISRVMVLACENGERAPSPKMLIAIAEALHVQPRWLLCATATPTLAQLRFSSGLVLGAVAKVLEISDHAVSRLERGLSPLGEQRATALAALYGVSIDQVKAAYELGSGDKSADRAACHTRSA